jgi:3-deoxy-manno-octulosonate cytidylyltransferase (CMP-KDO synthetase)
LERDITDRANEKDRKKSLEISTFNSRTVSKVIGVIPARYASSRFPAKVLANISGKSLIRRTYENIKQAHALDELMIAVDNQLVFDHVKEFCDHVVMTPVECESGSARAAFVIENHFPNCDIVVNIQADEPCLHPDVIDTLVQDLIRDTECVMTTPVIQISDIETLLNPNIPKCVFDKNKRALYFSRSPIPYVRKDALLSTYYRHMGVYAFRRSFLATFNELSQTPLREVEDLEQLRVLEHGYKIGISTVAHDGVEVNHPEDIQKVEEFLCKKNTSLSQAASSPHLARV